MRNVEARVSQTMKSEIPLFFYAFLEYMFCSKKHSAHY